MPGPIVIDDQPGNSPPSAPTETTYVPSPDLPRNLRPSYPKPHRRRAAGLASSLLECISIYTLFTFARPSGTSGTGIQGAGPIVIEASRTPLRASTETKYLRLTFTYPSILPEPKALASRSRSSSKCLAIRLAPRLKLNLHVPVHPSGT